MIHSSAVGLSHMGTPFRLWDHWVEQIDFRADMLAVGSFRTIDDALFADLGETQARIGAADQLAETVSNGSLLGQVEEILGEDTVPDAAFFVDSWTMGVAVASENFRRRQEELKIREHEMDARTFSFPPFFVAGEEAFGEVQWPLSELSAGKDSISDHLADEHDDQPEVIDEIEMVRPLTFESACRVLGVEAMSTREQIRATYRKLAIRYHPDRLVRGEASAQKLASDRMAYLNEAYRLLCAALTEQRTTACSR